MKQYPRSATRKLEGGGYIVVVEFSPLEEVRATVSHATEAGPHKGRWFVAVAGQRLGPFDTKREAVFEARHEMGVQLRRAADLLADGAEGV